MIENKENQVAFFQQKKNNNNISVRIIILNLKLFIEVYFNITIYFKGKKNGTILKNLHFIFNHLNNINTKLF